MNAISSYEASSKTRTRRQSHVAHQALTAASSKVAPARRAIHPDLAVRARQQDEFLRRLHRFSPLFDGAYGARKRHADRVGETFRSLRSAAADEGEGEAETEAEGATLPTHMLSAALQIYDADVETVEGVVDALKGDATVARGFDRRGLAMAADVAQATDGAEEG